MPGAGMVIRFQLMVWLSQSTTIKASTVTGNFADMLNWAGTSEDEFNEKLEQCSDNSERAQLVLDEMANQGFIKSADA